jgi:hypothetical protein
MTWDRAGSRFGEFLGKEQAGIEFPRLSETAALRKQVGVVGASRLRDASRRKLIWPALGFWGLFVALCLFPTAALLR